MPKNTLKSKLYLSFILSFSLFVCACTDYESPIEVEVYPLFNIYDLPRNSPYLSDAYLGRNFMYITAVADDVVIESIKMNRGNCNVGGFREPKKAVVEFNKKLDYGQVWSVPIVNCTKVLESEIETNYGTFIFEW